MTPTTWLWLVVLWTIASAMLGLALGRWLAAVAIRHQAITHDERPSALPAHRVGRFW